MNIDKYSLGTKIYVSQSFTAGLLILLGTASIFGLMSLEKSLTSIIKGEAKKIELTGVMATSIERLAWSQRGIVLGTLTGDAKQASDSRALLGESNRATKQALDEIGRILYTEEGKAIHARLLQASSEYERQLSVFDGHLQAQRFDEATKMNGDVFVPLLDKMRNDAAAMIRLQLGLMAEAGNSAETQVSVSLWLTIGLCLLAAAVSVVAFWVIRKANVDLRRIASEIAEGSRQVASAAQQVSSSSQALAQGSSEQAATLQETSASTEEINSMTQKNAENASNAAVETEKADQLLKETDQKLTQMIDSMREINTSSEKIGKIIRVIDEIAFQTNILALNAAVEAARAGEAGMGFAVVADEVRNLAQRCAQAAKDTSDLIEESIVRSNDGKVRLDEVATCVTKVFDNASRIKLLANEVHVGSQEQARGIEQIARAVAQMQQVTQSTAASAEEGASAGEEMSAQAHTLHDAVDRLRDLVGGGEENHGARKVPSATHRMPVLTAAKPAHQHRAPAHAPAPPAKAALAAKSQIPLDDDFSSF